MAYVNAIVGESGTGKSTAINTLDPKSTYIINVQNKPLPWKGSKNSFNKESKNIAFLDSWDKIVERIKAVANNSEIKHIIIDDALFIMTTEYFKRASETGYGKFSELAQHMFYVIDTAKNMREDLHIFFMFHPEIETDYLGNKTVCIKTVGKMVSNSYLPEASFTTVLYTKVDFDKEGNPNYNFVTNRTIDCPAKSPKGMFDSTLIPNDLNYVVTVTDKYYN